MQLTKNALSINKKYLTDELANINKIKEVSVKFQNEEQNFVIKMPTKSLSGQSSIFVDALISVSVPRKRSPLLSGDNVAITFKFNLKDRRNGSLIRESTMLSAYFMTANEFKKLPRVIEDSDKKIKIKSDFFDMFRNQYETVFGYNLVIEENVPKNANRNRIKRAKKRLFKTYGASAKSYLRLKLFEYC